MTTIRQVARFLRASLDQSIDAASRVDLVVGSTISLVGLAMHVDLAPLALAVVLGTLLVRWLVLTPAAMWAKAERRKGKRKGVTVLGDYIENYYASDASSSAGTVMPTSVESSDSGTFTEEAAVLKVSRSAPRSRRKSRRDPPDQPPLPGF